MPLRENERKWRQDKILYKIPETQSIPTANITAAVGTTYDSDGNPASLTTPEGRVLNYTYSPRSQLI